MKEINGDKKIGPPSRSLVERFWEKVDKQGPDDCWNWIAGKNCNGGYGAIRRTWREPVTVANRISWELHYGEIPDKMCVLHTCDNRACVNPKHLFLGTQKDNYLDMVAKGRRRNAVGERCALSKLKSEDVIAIRTMYPDIKSTRKLAKMFGIGRKAISQIVNKKTWKHLL